MTKRSEARKQFLADVLTTALAGGIGHWSELTAAYDEHGTEPAGEYLEEFTHGPAIHAARILDYSDGSQDGTPHTLDLDTIDHGLAQLQDEDTYTRQLRDADRTNGKAGHIHPEAADAVIQLALRPDRLQLTGARNTEPAGEWLLTRYMHDPRTIHA